MLFFIFDLLNHKYLTFEVRKDILKKICKLRKIERIPFKKLEELQNNVNKSQTELDKFKNNKEEQVNKYLESIVNQSEQFLWD